MQPDGKIDLEEILARIKAGGADTLLTRGEAAALIAARVKSPNEPDRASRNRIAMQMDRSRSVSGSALTGGLEQLPSMKFTADEISRWARLRFPDKFDDLPTKTRTELVREKETIRFSETLSEEMLPGGLDASHYLIEQLRAKIKQLKEEAVRENEEQRRLLAARFKKGT